MHACFNCLRTGCRFDCVQTLENTLKWNTVMVRSGIEQGMGWRGNERKKWSKEGISAVIRSKVWYLQINLVVWYWITQIGRYYNNLSRILRLWSGVFHEKLIVYQGIRIFPDYCGTRRFNTVSTKAPLIPVLSQVDQIHPFWLSSCSIWYLYSPMLATSPAHLILLVLISRIFVKNAYFRMWIVKYTLYRCTIVLKLIAFVLRFAGEYSSPCVRIVF